ncbi:DUF1405 domain-containing protein [Gorillibacterium sp. sgz5001074]|uniref:DUF1405 domain-containing protein n=1 Tax=Gorillibacterium sp. sgz5001074 TaxID=3446695 RepID=UPI003F67FF1B
MQLRRLWNQVLYWLSPEGLRSGFMLSALLWINAIGTVYGYYWYGGQIEDTLVSHPIWHVLMVPDSPTASLFFTAAIWWLYKEPERRLSSPGVRWFRSFIEAFAVVTSVKYGIWAVSIIAMGAAQGGGLSWQDYMLSGSHLGMAVEALLYVRFFRIGMGPLAAVAVWTLFNDYADYAYIIYPYLPLELDDDVGTVQTFTVYLSIVSLLITWLASKRTGKSRV